jgi:cell division septum initiation protein DivIVA
MALRRRDKSSDGSWPSYSGLGSRIEGLLRLAEEQRDQILAEAHQEAARIVDDARSQAAEILADARLQADQPTGGVTTEPGAGQEPGCEAAGPSPHLSMEQQAPDKTT